MMRFAPICLALLAGLPALAECPDPSRPLKRAEYDSGMTMDVLSREGDTVRYLQTIVKSGVAVEMTVEAANFTLSALKEGQGATLAWQGDLPTVADYVAGASFTAEAMLTTTDGLPPRPFKTEVTIIGEEEITVAGCAFPTLKMEVHSFEAGKSLGVTTKWVHMPTLLTLKSVQERDGNLRPQEAVTVE